MKNLIFICFLAISNCLFGQPAVTISVQGVVSWDKDFKDSNLNLTEAGNDYVGTYESDPNATSINIDAANQTIDYRVVIHKVDFDVWPTSLDLQIKWIKTNGNGSRNGLVSYTSILPTDQVFYETKGKSNTDKIQFQIKGISVLLPAKLYQTTVVFTVMQI